MAGITTRTGDSGESSIKDQRLSKGALVFDVLGSLDELNCWVGNLPPFKFQDDIQRDLMALSADLAGYTPFVPSLVEALEEEIERLSAGRPFSLVPPRGPVHVARTVCRRAERDLVRYAPDHAGIPFVNRLSDYLFVLAEYS